MLVAIIGENCVGKSALASQITSKMEARVFSGKDYLRLEKSPTAALEAFKKILKEAVNGANIIYLITEKEHLNLLPENCFRIVLTASLETIKERFKNRMHGNLPAPVEKMLEIKHGIYDELACNLKLGQNYNIEEVIKAFHS